MSKLKRLEATQAAREETREESKGDEVENQLEETSPQSEQELENQQPVSDPVGQESQAEGTIQEDQPTLREQALLKEVERLRAKNKEAGIEEKKDRELEPLTPPAGESTQEITKGEAVLYNSWQQEVLDEFLEQNPQYAKSDAQWQKFQSEFHDRISLIEAAKRANRPLTKRFIRERLESIHRAIKDDASVREEAKKDFAKSQSLAKLAGAGNVSGERQQGFVPERRRILPKSNSGLKAWVSK